MLERFECSSSGSSGRSRSSTRADPSRWPDRSCRQAAARSWEPPLRLLSVGRLDPEKNPLLLAAVVGALRRDGRDWRLQVVGTGPLRDALAARVAALGLGDAIELAGYFEAGPALWDR